MRPISRSLLAALSLLPLSFACSVADEFNPEPEIPPIPAVKDERGKIDSYIRGLEQVPVDPPQIIEGADDVPVREGDYSCATQNFTETRQYDKLVAYTANSESLWPGALIRGDAIQTGLFTQVGFERAPLAFSISLESLSGAKSAIMQQPSLSSFREELGKVLASEVTGATAASLYAEVEEVHSKDQLSLALGAGVSWPGVASFSTSFNFDRKDIKSRYLVKYIQAYYTVDVDQPGTPSSFLNDSVTLSEVKSKLPPGSPPVYVSSITYGRMVLFTFESQYSAEEMEAALDFVYRGGVDVSGNVSLTYKDMISRSNITAYILGGSGGEAAKSIDSYAALMGFIKSGGNYTKDSPGAPIAYKLAYLKDNTPARLSFTEEYEVKNCERVSQRVKVTLKSIDVESAGGDAGDNLELYGTIRAEAETTATLFDKDAGNHVRISQGQFWPTQGHIAESIIHVVPKAGHSISLHVNLIDDDGIFPHDTIGNEVIVVPIETGWRRDVRVLLTGDDARVAVTIGLEPI
ncbi:MAG: thiol-activated cytolysin family protein [Deltaproteobacteria bacterium]|nr:thiol-activated cytolysin family protein [Deltaproteobacteria bacterium]